MNSPRLLPEITRRAYAFVWRRVSSHETQRRLRIAAWMALLGLVFVPGPPPPSGDVRHDEQARRLRLDAGDQALGIVVHNTDPAALQLR